MIPQVAICPLEESVLYFCPYFYFFLKKQRIVMNGHAITASVSAVLEFECTKADAMRSHASPTERK